MSPTSTSEPPPLPPAGPHGPAAPVSGAHHAAPLPAASGDGTAGAPVDAGGGHPHAAPGTRALIRGFLGDALLAALVLVVASLLFVVPLIAFEAVRSTGGNPAGLDIDALTESLMPQIAAASVLAMLVAAMAVWWLRGRRVAWPVAPMPALPAYALAIPAGLLIQAVCLGFVLLSHRFGAPIAPSNADPVQAMAERAPWLAWITVVGLAPLAEELLFRHVLLRRFAAAGRGVLGIVVTSLLFAAMHELAPGQPDWAAWLSAVALYATMGAGFGAVYLATRRVGVAVLAHAACNAAAMTLAAFSLL